VLEFDSLTEPRNPGGWSCYGWVIRDMFGQQLYERHGVSARPGPRSTVNYGEYCALGFALSFLAEQGWRGELLIRGDSQLVIFQLTDRWRCLNGRLLALRHRCRTLLNDVAHDNWHAEWVAREENTACDELSRRAYTEATGQPVPERRFYRRRRWK
jgi:ribonuclease HI